MAETVPPEEIVVRITCADPLAGAATAEDGTSRGFHGWLGLMGALAALIGSPAPFDSFPEEFPSKDEGLDDSRCEGEGY